MQYSLLDQMKDRFNLGGATGQDMGNFTTSANSGNDGQLGTLLSTVLSSYGPVGAGIGNAVGTLVDSGGHVRQAGENYSPGQRAGEAFAKGAVGSYLGGEANAAAGEIFGKGVEQAADKTVQAGGNSLLASDAAGATMGDAYKVSLADGMQLQVDPNMTTTQPISNGARPTMQTGTGPSMADKAAEFGKNRLSGATSGLSDIFTGDAKSNIKPTGAGGYDFMEGLTKGGNLGNTYASLHDGNIAGGVGQGTRLVIDNYRPPSYDADKFKQKFQIRY